METIESKHAEVDYLDLDHVSRVEWSNYTESLERCNVLIWSVWHNDSPRMSCLHQQHPWTRLMRWLYRLDEALCHRVLKTHTFFIWYQFIKLMLPRPKALCVNKYRICQQSKGIRFILNLFYKGGQPLLLKLFCVLRSRACANKL